MPIVTPPGTPSVLTVGGSVVSVPRTAVLRRLVPHSRGGVESFSFSVRGGPLPPTPDPYLGKPMTLSVNGTLRFTGDVASRNEEFVPGLGWVQTYQCLGLKNRLDWIPHTDSNTGLDQSSYNLAPDSGGPDYIAARSGRTVGQILTDVLTMADNAAALNALGLVNYTTLSPPTLPSATVSDLAAMSVIPQTPVSFGGEKLGGAIEAFVATFAPNYLFRVRPDGTFRFPDLRAYTAATLTLGTDPVRMPSLSRDAADCFTRVVGRGQPIAEMFNFDLSLGGLSESPFAHDGLSVAAAKAAWTPADFLEPALMPSSSGSTAGPGRVAGTCSCPSTTTVTVTSEDSATAFPANFWDQSSTGHQGTVLLAYSLGTTITTYTQRKVVSNTAMTAGGTSTLTLDRALPHLLFDHFLLAGTAKNSSAVWCRYALPSWAGPKVAQQSTYPFPYQFASGAGVTLTSTALGTVVYGSGPPYQETSVGVQVDAGTGTVLFGRPTYMSAGNQVPHNVRALVPINVGVNQAVYPANSGSTPVYGGTAYSVEGIQRTLTVTVPSWRDPANLTAVTAYVHDLFDSVSQTVIEGTLEFMGLYEPALETGAALNIAGNGYTTGWESAALPVVECQLDWNVNGLSHTTTMKLSNRRAHWSSEQFLHPDRTGLTWGRDDSDPTPPPTVGGSAAGASAASDFGNITPSAETPQAITPTAVTPNYTGDLT